MLDLLLSEMARLLLKHVLADKVSRDCKAESAGSWTTFVPLDRAVCLQGFPLLVGLANCNSVNYVVNSGPTDTGT